MAQKFTSIFTAEGVKPLPQFSQAVVYNGLVYVSGNVGFKPGPSAELVEGTTKDRAVSDRTWYAYCGTKSRILATNFLQHSSGFEGSWQQS